MQKRETFKIVLFRVIRSLREYFSTTSQICNLSASITPPLRIDLLKTQGHITFLPLTQPNCKLILLSPLAISNWVVNVSKNDYNSNFSDSHDELFSKHLLHLISWFLSRVTQCYCKITSKATGIKTMLGHYIGPWAITFLGIWLQPC